MTSRELDLLEKLLERQKELIEVVGEIVDTQAMIADALAPMRFLTADSEDGGPMTMQ